ncbi:MAG: dihydrolipoyl dehydrogenase [Desulfobulbaceae bacterium]|nr:MAG: dihydrolipoyl dehydrogenase [Desulfobulbaceae bacterium]
MNKKIAILGAGPGGYVAAIRLAQTGADVTLIEKERLGGTCLNWGCIPSKIFKQTADSLETLRHAEEFAITANPEAQCNMPALIERKERIIAIQAGGIHGLLQKNGVTLHFGNGVITGNHSISIRNNSGQETVISWDRLILATGSRPADIPTLSFDGVNILSSNDIFSLQTIPESLAIVGGGVIGCELACIFQGLGSRVTLVEAMDRLLPLPSVDEECSKLLLREMKKKKIRILTGSTVQSARVENGRVELSIGKFRPVAGKDSAAQQESCEKLLVCIGRTANSSGIGLESIGVECDEKGWVKTNSRLQTSNENVYAIGDILGPAKIMLAHVASTEGEIAAANCMGDQREMHYDVVPSAIFTTPEIGAVGLSESEARSRDAGVRADTVLFRTLGKAQILGEIAGQAKIVSEKETGRILGVHIAGPHATDLIAEATLAMKLGATVHDLAETIHAHPTLAEIMLETSFKALDRPLHG